MPDYEIEMPRALLISQFNMATVLKVGYANLKWIYVSTVAVQEIPD